MQAGIVLGSVADLLAAGLFAFVGWQLSRRTLPSHAKRAARGFHLWWASVAAIWALDGARGLAYAAGLADDGAGESLFVGLYYVFVLVLCVALWGLLTYLVYLYKGVDASGPLGAFYALGFLTCVVAVAYAGPSGVEAGQWTTVVPYERPLSEWAQAALFLLLLAPQLLGAAVYLLLASRVESPPHRFRIVVVSSALLAWIGANLVADLSGWTGLAEWQVARRLLGVGAALAILLAYHPPRAVRRWLETRQAELSA